MIVPVSVELLMTVTGFWQYENQKKSQSNYLWSNSSKIIVTLKINYEYEIDF